MSGRCDDPGRKTRTGLGVAGKSVRTARYQQGRGDRARCGGRRSSHSAGRADRTHV